MYQVPEKVYQLLGVDIESESNPWFGGTTNFKNVPYRKMKEVAEILGGDFLEGRQNNSPTHEEYLESLAPYEAETTFNGYIVSSKRSDERVSIESVKTAKNDHTIEFLRYADDFHLDEDSLYACFN